MKEFRYAIFATVATLIIPTLALAGVQAGTVAKPNGVNNVKPGVPPSLFPSTALDCVANAGDVARTVYITNNTKLTLKKGALVYWSMKVGASGPYAVLHGKVKTDTPIKPGMMLHDSALPGNGGPCTAWTYV
jgi:hypothetical protein